MNFRDSLQNLRHGGLSGLGLGLMILIAHEGQASQCIVTASTTSFGVYNPSNLSPLDTTGTLTVNCTGTGNVSYSIALSTGGNQSYSPRKMTNSSPSYQLIYNLYVDGARTIPWGNGTGGTATISDAYHLPGSGTETRTYTIYGRVPAGQPNPAGGSYLDTITVTVTY